MKRLLMLPILLGTASVFFPIVTLAATITYEVSYGPADPVWTLPDPDANPPLLPLKLAQFDPSKFENGILKSVQFEATANTTGSYTLENTGTGKLHYGKSASEIGATIEVTGLSDSLTLMPNAIQNAGQGTLNSGQKYILAINGAASDIKAFNDPNAIQSYIGTGTMDFSAEALSFKNISIVGKATEDTDIKAQLLLRVTYEYAPQSQEIPESNLNWGIFSIAFCGLTSLVFNNRGNYR